MSDHEQFTPTELRVLFDAWAAAQDDLAFAIEDVYLPEAHRLAEQGWLERRFNDHNGDSVFMWSEQADGALQLSHAMTTAKESVN
jgi:hypothetical protein